MAMQTQFTGIKALIIDDMAVQQSTLRGQLALLGISEVDSTTNAEDATRLIRSRGYGLILCDYNLNNKTDGQQLFEHLRDTGVLTSDCLFFMVTAENSYVSVASATEHHPDAYLLKPITASDIEDRLKMLLEKREALLAVNRRLAKDDLTGALDECDKLLALKNRWFMQVLHIKGKTLLKLGKHEEAKDVFRMALEARPELVWAQLGLARAHKAASQFDEAKRLAQEIIQSPGGKKNVAAYDVVAESMEAQGDPQGAMDILKEAAAVVPSARRNRIVGESAYRNGDLETAKLSFQKVTKATRGSVIAQPQDTLTLAQAMVDMNLAGEALKVLDDAAFQYKKEAAFGDVALAIQVQAEVRSGNTEAAAKTLARVRELGAKGKADFATIALAKAELMTGHEEAGMKLMESALSADHENPRLKQLISKALHDTGHEDKIGAVVNSVTAVLEAKVNDARKLLRDSKIDEAVAAIETATRDYPDNTGVLLQAAQINCMALRLKKTIDTDMVERVQYYLARLDKLIPGHDRVTMMQRYFRETLSALETASLTH